ncbi:lysylphosphatidylglycerol synthase domain-containing protein [Paenibacillus sp. QZ-Y1]|uniref:lysylphosphatidylglycerol synthase domain-containing protein n=1 Tax=Paenibacillus sp. QZ-Y1 TaxID=3414511 RepID=UPI003F7AED93
MRHLGSKLFSLQLLLFGLGISFSLYLAYNFRFIETRFSYFIVIAIICYLIAHLIRICRLYILFIDRRFSFSEIVKVYIITTWINFVIPFKFGEIYRILEFSKLCRSFKMGIVAIWIERFFDSLLLMSIFIMFVNYHDKNHFIFFALLFLFLMLSVFCFFSFLPTFRYINRFLLSESKSPRGLLALEIMSSAREYYVYAKKLLNGKLAILLGTTFLVWVLEFFTYYLVLASIGSKFRWAKINDLLYGLWGIDNIDNSYRLVAFYVLLFSSIVVLLRIIYKRVVVIFKDVNNKETYYIDKYSDNKN